MKIRTSFVSNSSSSSYIIVARKASNVDDVQAGLPIYVRGEGIEGDDFFELTEEMKKLIRTGGASEGYGLYEVYKSFWEPSYDGVDIPKAAPDGFRLFAWNVDMYCTEDMESFLRNYGDTSMYQDEDE